MLSQDGREALNGAKDGAMNDDGPAEAGLELLLVPRVVLRVVLVGWEVLRGQLDLLLLVLRGGGLLLCRILGLVLQVEADRLLEVELDGSALVRPVQRVVDLDVDLGPVKGSVAVVEGPLEAAIVQGDLKCTLCLVPQFITAKPVLWPRRQLQLEREVKDGVNVLQEVQTVRNLARDLIRCAENVSIILLEPSDTDQSTEGTRDLVSVQSAEIGVAQGQVTIAVDAMREEHAMRGAIHGLKTETGPLRLEKEHVLLVLLIMA